MYHRKEFDRVGAGDKLFVYQAKHHVTRGAKAVARSLFWSYRSLWGVNAQSVGYEAANLVTRANPHSYALPTVHSKRGIVAFHAWGEGARVHFQHSCSLWQRVDSSPKTRYGVDAREWRNDVLLYSPCLLGGTFVRVDLLSALSPAPTRSHPLFTPRAHPSRHSAWLEPLTSVSPRPHEVRRYFPSYLDFAQAP